jgi:rare lipoprotein A
MVRVTNLKNDKSVIVRINDRGPYKYPGRIIDLTLAAADAIGMTKYGLVPVKIEVVGEGGKINQIQPSLPGMFEPGKFYNFRGEIRNPKGYGVQVAEFSDMPSAKYYARELFKEGFREIVIKVNPTPSDTTAFKVMLGEFDDISDARDLIKKLKMKDFTGFPVRY